MSATRKTAYSIVGLMLISILASFGGLIAENQNTTPELKEEPTEFQQTAQGTLFLLNMSGHTGVAHVRHHRPTYDNLYGTPMEAVEVSLKISLTSHFWESASTGWPSDHQSTEDNTSIHWYPNCTWETLLPRTYYTSRWPILRQFIPERWKHEQRCNDYSVSVIQSQNGNNMDIDITASYMGSGSKTVYIYAAVTEETSPETYMVVHQTHTTFGRSGC